VNGMMNKKRPIENTVEVNIYYQGHRERTEIDVIEGQKWNVILRMLWLAHHNSEINWKTDEVKMMRCLEECGRQWRLKQEKSGWQKQKEEEVKKQKEEEARRKQRKKNQKRKKVIDINQVAEEWEIWDDEEEAARSEEEAKKLVLKRFYK